MLVKNARPERLVFAVRDRAKGRNARRSTSALPQNGYMASRLNPSQNCSGFTPKTRRIPMSANRAFRRESTGNRQRPPRSRRRRSSVLTGCRPTSSLRRQCGSATSSRVARRRKCARSPPDLQLHEARLACPRLSSSAKPCPPTSPRFRSCTLGSLGRAASRDRRIGCARARAISRVSASSPNLGGQLVASLRMTEITIGGATGAALLGPVAVEPAHRANWRRHNSS